MCYHKRYIFSCTHYTWGSEVIACDSPECNIMYSHPLSARKLQMLCRACEGKIQKTKSISLVLKEKISKLHADLDRLVREQQEKEKAEVERERVVLEKVLNDERRTELISPRTKVFEPSFTQWTRTEGKTVQGKKSDGQGEGFEFSDLGEESDDTEDLEFINPWKKVAPVDADLHVKPLHPRVVTPSDRKKMKPFVSKLTSKLPTKARTSRLRHQQRD
ncbi:hypothetical protein BGZ60DRAFT_429500 [Tricladium varicosporioides]|nr:hypothetical protein BGZ60DRAFT_429500 [Hymenoscyphus varicosporioides]